MTKDLYLINPPNPMNMKGFPGSLLALDAWVRERNLEVRSTILDEEDTSLSELKLSLESKLNNPSGRASETPYFGITCTTATYQDALATVKALKEVRPNAIIILGGHHIGGQEQVILGIHPEIGILVSGEGEKALEDIIKGNLDAPGISYRKGSEIVTSPQKGIRLTGKELDRYANIRNFNPQFLTRATQFEETNLITARGCPMECAFCAVGEEAATAQDPDIVIGQVDYLTFLKGNGNPLTIAIQDNFFAQNPKRAKKIAEKLIEYRERTGHQFEWNMQTRVEQFNDPSLVALVAKAGCTAAYFGIENFDPRMLKVLNKAHNTDRYVKNTLQAVRNCLEYNIQPHIDFQVGILGEDDKTQKINIATLKEIGKDSASYGQKPIVFPSLSVVYPGTAFHANLMKENVPNGIYEVFTRWERDNPDYREAIHGYFAHGNGGIPRGIIDIKRLKQGSIMIQEDALSRVKNYVDGLKKIEGIVIHDFKNPTREKT